ncbi:MAG: polyphenol oxidase family protein [Muribaculaceae bacterium]|nr:polyphenol oxidase family protein [Muribaculaceae bacterium]
MNETIVEETFGVGEAVGKIRFISASGEVSPQDINDVNAPLRELAVLPIQTHSLNVAVVDADRRLFPDTDALITFRPHTPIGVLTADCVPILLYVQDIKAVAAIHAGWRGTLGGIVDNVLDTLEHSGCKPGNIHAFIGPAISVDNYEVDHDLAEEFSRAGFQDYIIYPDETIARPHIDLKGVNRYRLSCRGVPAQNIITHPACTYGYLRDDGLQYPSHRRSHGSPQRLLTTIELTDNN